MTGDDSLERLVAEIPDELKKLVDADPRNNREVAIASLWREFGGQRLGVLERQIEEKKNRVSIVEHEIESRKQELAKLKTELEALRQKAKAVEDNQEDTIADAREALEGVPRNPDNPGIKNWADKLGLTEQALIDKLEQHDD